MWFLELRHQLDGSARTTRPAETDGASTHLITDSFDYSQVTELAAEVDEKVSELAPGSLHAWTDPVTGQATHTTRFFRLVRVLIIALLASIKY